MTTDNDPRLALLYQQTVALNQIAEAGQRLFIDDGYADAGTGPVAIRIGESMRTILIGGGIASCPHPSQPAVWLPTASSLLRCNACFANAWPVAREQCAGCEKAIDVGGAFVGLIPAQVVLDRTILGPWLVVYTLCTDCQRVDAGGSSPPAR